MFEILVTFIAGVVSFISPCVLPLVPAYIGYMGGRVSNTVSAQVSVGTDGTAVAKSKSTYARFSTFLHGVAFVAGFTFIFVMLGVLTSALASVGGRGVVENIIGRIGGIIIIFFGLHFMGLVPRIFNQLRQRPLIYNNVGFSISIGLILTLFFVWGFTGTVTPWLDDPIVPIPEWTVAVSLILSALTFIGLFMGSAFSDPEAFWNKAMNTVEVSIYTDTRREMDANGNQGFLGSALMGIVFAAGWSPCIGPALGTAMTFAASSGSEVAEGGILLGAYSLGLGIPFLLTALMLDSAQGILRSLQRRMALIELISGLFLIFIGVLVASGRLQELSQEFSTGEFADTAFRIETCVVGFVEGDVDISDVGDCLSGDYVIEENVDNNEEAIDSNAVNSITGLANTVDLGDLDIGLQIGNIAPDFETTDLAGETVRLSDYRGEIVLLNFWYTTCGPCRIEMPEFQETFTENSDNNFTIVAVNREESIDEITDFTDDLGLTFPILLDESGQIQEQYNVIGYPRSYLLDENGIILNQNFGALTSSQIQEWLEEALESSSGVG